MADTCIDCHRDKKPRSDLGGHDLSGDVYRYPDPKDTKARVPTYRYAQKLAMERGDAGTYFMRKTTRNSRGIRGRGSKRK